jgi:hypothetical protein
MRGVRRLNLRRCDRSKDWAIVIRLAWYIRRETTAIVGTARTGETTGSVTAFSYHDDRLHPGHRFPLPLQPCFFIVTFFTVSPDRCIELAMRMGLVSKIGAARVEVSSKNKR